MADWFEALEKMGLAAVTWPYPVRYGVENEVDCDVVSAGRWSGRLHGCHKRR